VTDGEPSDLTFEDILAAAAEGLDAVTARRGGEAITWVAGAPPAAFARLEQGGAAFRLDPLVAQAALRTPGTAPSPLGPEWVRFAPESLDDAAVDRAEAWFLSAYRRAIAGR